MFVRLLRSRTFLPRSSQQLTSVSVWRTRLYSSKPETVANGVNDDLTTPQEDKISRKIVSNHSPRNTDVSNRNWLDKVLFNTYLQKFMPPPTLRNRLKQGYEERIGHQAAIIGKTAVLPPVSFKHFLQLKLEQIENTDTNEDANKEGANQVVQFPFKVTKKPEFAEDESKNVESTEERMATQEDHLSDDEDNKKHSDPGKFVSLREQLEKHDVDLDTVLTDQPSIADAFKQASEVSVSDIGTADPRIPPSSVPCGGCGALLHCQDQSIPGYMPSEKFKKAKKADLMEDICYRCGVLEAHQATLNVNVSPEEYPRIVGKIRDKYAMALLMVDLTDFPCSIWPGILDIIGNRRPIMLIGNKVDQLPTDDPDFLKRVEDSLIKCVVELGMVEANIIHTALISAKTGYGVEKLISDIFNMWRGRGDLFLLGCTNVGKSTLFNLLMDSDLCKPQACDLVQRSTVSQWPGTTLNLLKFPMTNPQGWRKALRSRRLEAESPVVQAEERERRLMFQKTGDPEHVILKGSVGKTFLTTKKEEEMEKHLTVKDIFNVKAKIKYPPSMEARGRWDPEHPDFSQGYWVYDTPGAVNPNQILDLLTLPELMQTLPKDYIHPRTFYVLPEMTMFIGGLARLDYGGSLPIRFTLFTNNDLPVTVCQTSDAEEVYNQAVGTKVFGVPNGSQERLAQFPELKCKTVELVGEGHGISCADVVLSSMGWVALTGTRGDKFSLSVYTPDGRGIFIREPSLIPYAIRYKGRRIRGTFAYLPHKVMAPRLRRSKKQPRFS